MNQTEDMVIYQPSDAQIQKRVRLYLVDSIQDLFLGLTDSIAIQQLKAQLHASLCLHQDIQLLHIQLLTDELLFAEGVACLTSEDIYWTLLQLALHGPEEEVQRLSYMLLGREGRREGISLRNC